MYRVQLQLDVDLDSPEACVEWVRKLALAMEAVPEVIEPVVDSEMAPPLRVTKKGPKAPDLIDLLNSYGREEATPTGRWVKIDDYGQERVTNPEEHDYRNTPEGRQAELERYNRPGH